MRSIPATLKALQHTCAQLSISELQSLQHLIAELIKEKSALHALPERPNRIPVTQKHIGRATYQLEKVKCGKAGCRCAQKNGQLHGPYWYVYRWNGKKVVSEYVGKTLPNDCL